MDNIFNTFDKNLYRIGSPVFMGDGTPLTSISGISQSNLDSGYLTGNTEMVEGNLQSGNFLTGVSGWQIDAEGNVEFNDGTFRGTFILGGTLITVSDIADFQDAIDAVYTLGGGTVAFTPGTYIGTTSYTIPSGVTIDGNGAILDFNGGSYSLSAVGTDVYQTGTLTATYGSTGIVGVGTTWTAGMVGRSILIYDFWYTISAFVDSTHLTLSEPFFEVTIAGTQYTIATTVESVSVVNLTIQNSTASLPFRFLYCNGIYLDSVLSQDHTGNGIDIGYSADATVSGCTAKNCDTNMRIFGTPFLSLSGCTSIGSAATGISISSTHNSSIEVVSIHDSGGVGLLITGSSNTGLINFSIIKGASHGIQMQQNSGVDVISGFITACGADGIRLTSDVDDCSFSDIGITNNTGYGFNIAASSCDRNYVTNISYSGNGSGEMSDSGTGTIKFPDAGTYTPTRSAEANMDANVTMFQAQYMRNGNTVTVSGRFTADPTLAATATSFEMTLPVASNFGAVEDCAGVAFCGAIAGMGAQVSGSVANNTMVVSWVSSDITSQSWSFTATYQVI